MMDNSTANSTALTPPPPPQPLPSNEMATLVNKTISPDGEIVEVDVLAKWAVSWPTTGVTLGGVLLMVVVISTFTKI